MRDTDRIQPADSHATVGTPVAEQRWGLSEAAVGVALALALAWLVGFASSRGLLGAGPFETMLSFAAVWAALLGAVLYASFRRGRGSLKLDFGLRFTWLDILFGLTLGFVLRSIATLIEILLYGRPAGGSIHFGPTVYDIWWIILAIVAPVLIAPTIEELFFRGLLQRAVLNASGKGLAPTSRVPVVVAVTVSSLIFALVHVLQMNGSTDMVAVGLSTLALGVGLGVLAAVTGRLGGAIIAHIVFNGLGVAATLL